MSQTKHKAFAYITHNNRLLVFSHPDFPEAGIQVPAGTIEDGEEPGAAALREAFEETGLTNLALGEFLGEQVRDMADFGRDEIHHRHFYHLRCTENPPETWKHGEMHPSDGTPGPIVFQFFWATLPNDIPPLIADHDACLPQLIENFYAGGECFGD